MKIAMAKRKRVNDQSQSEELRQYQTNLRKFLQELKSFHGTFTTALKKVSPKERARLKSLISRWNHRDLAGPITLEDLHCLSRCDSHRRLPIELDALLRGETVEAAWQRHASMLWGETVSKRVEMPHYRDFAFSAIDLAKLDELFPPADEQFISPVQIVEKLGELGLSRKAQSMLFETAQASSAAAINRQIKGLINNN